jgi:glutathione synthase/RimK-type ligase-like ATP-grasp enzyme
MLIAYVCYKSAEKFSVIENENDLLLCYLQQKGLHIRKAVWDDPAEDWSAYELVVLKAPWDYFDKFPHFTAWLDRLEQLQVPLLNPIEIVRWNSDKHYLQDIADAGLPIIPTRFIEKGEQPDLMPFFEALDSDKLIIKPAVSGGAKNTFVLSRDNVAALAPELLLLLQEESFMVQPFVTEIQTEGEWSFMFFGGQFSHCLLKTVKEGDFRVQHIHGGSVHARQAPEAMLELARQYTDRFARGCLYARVDGVMHKGQFALMELELIEPYHYLFTSESSFESYYQALKGKIGELVRG